MHSKEIPLSKEELRDAIKLADLFNDLDNGRRVDSTEKTRLYELQFNNPKIRYKALEINRKRLKERG